MSASSRIIDFASRHVWSLSLAGLSAVAFAELASEIAKGEPGAFDQVVASWVQAQRGTWDAPMLALTWFGSFKPMLVLVLVLFALLLAKRRRWEAVYLAACATGGPVLCHLLKLFFRRARPDSSDVYLISAPHSFSFPSGHAMASASVVGALVILVFALHGARPWRAAAVVLGVATALGVAASRVYFGVHYPSDVLGGQLAAAAWVAATTGWFYPRLLPAEATYTTS